MILAETHRHPTAPAAEVHTSHFAEIETLADARTAHTRTVINGLEQNSSERRKLGSRLGAWMRNSQQTGVAAHHINPDGSLKVEELRELPYFKERSILLDAYKDYQLSPKSKMRRQAVVLNALEIANKPSPIPRDAGPTISKQEMTRIFEAARDVGLNPVALAEELGASNRLGSFRRAYKDAYTKSVLITPLEDSSPKIEHAYASNDDHSIDTHHGHEHNHAHEHHHVPSSKPVISRTWQRSAVAGNLVVGLAEILTGNMTTLSATADGIHNAGDAATYYAQGENVLNKNLSEAQKLRRQKITYGVISALSAMTAAKAWMDLDIAQGIEADQHPSVMFSAYGSVLLNALLLATLYRGITRRRNEGTLTSHDKALTKHIWEVDIPSAVVALTGVYAQKYGLPGSIETSLAFLSGTFATIRFLPTDANMNHSDCALHGSHERHGHGHGHQEKPSRLRKFTRRALMTGATLGALGAGLFGIGNHNKATQEAIPTLPPSSDVPTVLQDAQPKTPNSGLSQIVYEATTPSQGDTFWEIAEEKLTDVYPQTNWVNIENGVTRNDVVIDFSRDMQEARTGANLNSIDSSDVISVINNMSSDEIHMLSQILETKSYEEVRQLMPQLQRFY